MNPQNLPKGAGAAETSGSGKPANAPGLYRHEASGKEAILMPDPKSTAQADAFTRAGYVRVGDAPTSAELQKMQQDQAAKTVAEEKDTPASTGSFGVSAIQGTPEFATTSTRTIDPSELDAANARAAAAEAALAKATSKKGAPAAKADATPDPAPGTGTTTGENEQTNTEGSN